MKMYGGVEEEAFPIAAPSPSVMLWRRSSVSEIVGKIVVRSHVGEESSCCTRAVSTNLITHLTIGRVLEACYLNLSQCTLRSEMGER